MQTDEQKLKRSPLPWGYKYVRGEYEVQDSRGYFIAGTGNNDKENEANAAFIVHCVNNYPKFGALNAELIEALEDWLKAYSKEQWNQVGGDEYQIKLENLIKRAKGGV